VCTSKTYQETTLKIRRKRCRMTICKFHKEMRGTRPHSSPRRDKPCMLRNDCADHYKCWSRLQLLWSLSSLSLIRNVTGDFDTIKISILLLFNNELDNLRENVFANGSKHCLQKRRKTVSLMDLKEWKHPKQWSRCEKKIAVNFGLEEAITWFPLHRYSKKNWI
jgi:hypothetical protein